MAYTEPFHTTQHESPKVYHDDDACPEGKKILQKHREKGTDGRQRCQVCKAR